MHNAVMPSYVEEIIFLGQCLWGGSLEGVLTSCV